MFSRPTRLFHSPRYCLGLFSEPLYLTNHSTYALASRKALFSMSSAPGPIMSEWSDEVVLRICDTAL